MMPYFIYRSCPFIVYLIDMRNNEGYMRKILKYNLINKIQENLINTFTSLITFSYLCFPIPLFDTNILAVKISNSTRISVFVRRGVS